MMKIEAKLIIFYLLRSFSPSGRFDTQIWMETVIYICALLSSIKCNFHGERTGLLTFSFCCLRQWFLSSFYLKLWQNTLKEPTLGRKSLLYHFILGTVHHGREAKTSGNWSSWSLPPLPGSREGWRHEFIPKDDISWSCDSSNFVLFLFKFQVFFF